MILTYYELSREAVAKGANFNEILELPVREDIGRFKYVEEKDTDEAYNKIMETLRKAVSALTAKEVEDDD